MLRFSRYPIMRQSHFDLASKAFDSKNCLTIFCNFTAAHKMIFSGLDELMFGAPAAGFIQRTLLPETAAGILSQTFRHFLFVLDHCILFIFRCIGCGGEQQMRIRVKRVVEKFIRRCILHDRTPVHDGNIAAQISHHVQIV